METLDTEKAQSHREELLGPGLVLGAPEEYWEMTAASQMGLTYTEYIKKPIHDRAMFRAWSFLKNAVDVIERHREIMKRKQKELLAKTAAPKPKKRKK